MPVACRSLSSVTGAPSFCDSPASVIVHGRFVIFATPATTGPATPNADALGAEELIDDRLERVELGALEHLLADDHTALVTECEDGLRPTHISRENHELLLIDVPRLVVL